ncbi:MAG: hypothetical protein IJX76_06125 [Clostridia bacterium]|nr:hypothetical protein [Clostridia bacterium]
MKHEVIWKSLSDIREDYIEEAAPDAAKTSKVIPLPKRSLRRRIIGWGAIAACVALIAVGAYPLLGGIDDPDESVADDAYGHYPVRSWNGYVTMNEASWRIFTFQYPINGENVQLEFPPVEWNGETYYLSQDHNSFVSVSTDEIGDVLFETEITAHGVADHEKSATLSATLSAYKGIDPVFGAVLTMEGVEGAVLYRTAKYADSLEELIEKAGFDEHLTASANIFHTTKNSSGEEVNLVFEGMTADILWNELLVCGETVDYDGEDGDWLRISIGHDLLQYNSILCVTSDGYITFSALKAGKAVYVGAERARAFLDYLEDNLTGYRLVEEVEDSGYAENETPETVTWTNANYGERGPKTPK